MNSGRVLVRLTAALLVAGIANACTNDRGATRSVAGPFASADVREGASIHGRLTRSLRLLGPGGSVRAESTTTEAFDAQVQNGKAKANGRGLLVALTGVRPVPRQPVSFTDSTGHRHQIEFESGAGGEPLRALRALLDGRLIARVEFTWRRAGRGFILAQRASTFFAPDGSEAAREDIATDMTEIAGAGAPRRGLASLAGSVGAAALPTPLVAEEATCFTVWFAYAVASLGVVIYGEALVATWWNPKSWLAFGVAVGVWDKALDAYLDCMMA
jgi:hypothetical protein